MKNLLKRFGVTGGGFLSLPVGGLKTFRSSWTGGVIPRLDIIVRYWNNGLSGQWRDRCKRKLNAWRMAGVIVSRELGASREHESAIET